MIELQTHQPLTFTSDGVNSSKWTCESGGAVSDTNEIRQLPALENKSSKFCFTDQQLALLQSHRPSFLANNWGLIVLSASMILIRAVAGASIFWPVALALIAVLLAIMLITLLAIHEVESGHYRLAEKLCNFGLMLGRISGNNWFAQMQLDQVKAVLLARQGKIVEAQLTYALWPLSKISSMSDTTLANLMGRGQCLERAAEIHLRRYEYVKSNGDLIAKAIVASNVGFANMMLSRPEIAKTYLEEAKALCRNLNFELKVNVLTNIARNNIQLGLLDDAEMQLSEVQKLIESRRRYMGQVVGEVQIGFAELRYLQNRLEEALLHLTSAREYFQDLGAGDPLRHYALTLHVKILEQMGRQAEAQETLEKFESEQCALDSHNEAIFEHVQQALSTGNLIDLRKISQ